jgi:hypothetical protein
MSPRRRLLLGFAAVLALGVVVAALGARGNRTPDADPRRSTFLAGPAGARGFAEALEQLGVDVRRHRGRVDALAAALADGAARDSELVAFLSPSEGLDAFEAEVLDGVRAAGTDLLLAGPGAEAALRCFGWSVRVVGDSAPVAPAGARPPHVNAFLVPYLERAAIDSSDAEAGVPAGCTVHRARATDTLLAASGWPVALRLEFDSGGTVLAVADGELFSNRLTRATDAGRFALGLVAGRYARLVVDERHHGYAGSSSAAGALLTWSLRSPWGWALWQLAAVALLVLLADAVRFGPARSVLGRRRRSPLEHVEALATALGAARGHDVAIGLLIGGLRRRLSRRGPAGAGAADDAAWLASLEGIVRSPRARSALAELRALTRPGQDAHGALRAAHAVEDVWQDLRPQTRA